MKRTLPFLISTLFTALVFSQPVLNFTAQTLSGPGLSQPVDITGCGDGSGRLFIVEKRGTIRIVQNGEVLSSFFLDIQTQVMNSGERGLLGLAFHPQYPDSPYIYVNYVLTQTITNRISRFTLNPNNTNDILESSQVILLSQAGIQSNHKAGDISFGPDGYLYFGMGDGGGGNDPGNSGQNLETWLGKILRIDINSTSPGLNYSNPPDNPFVGIDGKDEIWAYGIRNPWRISFDRLYGDFWIADVGQDAWEEVDMVPYGTPGGMNFGWDCQEGNHPSLGSCPGNTVFTWPVFEYPHSCNNCDFGYGNSITGGFVYRGDMYPVLEGCYVCADYGSNYMWMIKQTEFEPPAFDVYVQDGDNMITDLVAFGEDDDGELWASNLNGVLYAVSATGTLPVQWEDVIATSVLKGNKIKWTLHQTFGINHFEVQRSFHPGFSDYASIAEIQTIPDQITYIYEDPFLQPHTIYYRIAALMEDGSTEYSPVARIVGVTAPTPSLVYDQQNNTWRINIPTPWKDGELTLFDLQGKEVYTRSVTTNQYIDLAPPISPGCYFVKIIGEMGSWSEQLVW